MLISRLWTCERNWRFHGANSCLEKHLDHEAILSPELHSGSVVLQHSSEIVQYMSILLTLPQR